jgi:hypothetical protein
MLKFIVQRKRSEVYRNVFVLLRIITVVPVATASAKRNFSRLIDKDLSRNDNGTGLTILSTENDIASGLYYSEIVSFSSRKSRKRYF